MSSFKIGWGKRELSCDKPVSIPGQMYIRVSEGIHDPLYATAMCVDSGEEQVIFCTADLVVLRNGVIEMTRQKVTKLCPEIPVEKIIMGATHTHSGCCVTETPATTPDGKEIYPGIEYREFFTDQCAQAIVDAWQNRAEAAMA